MCYSLYSKQRVACFRSGLVLRGQPHRLDPSLLAPLEKEDAIEPSNARQLDFNYKVDVTPTLGQTKNTAERDKTLGQYICLFERGSNIHMRKHIDQRRHKMDSSHKDKHHP